MRRYCDVCWDTLPDAAFSAEERRYAHMCRDEHIEIGYNDSGDDERCPVCRERDRADAAEERVQQLGAALGHEFDPCNRPGERCEWGPDRCHHDDCGQPRAAHLPPEPTSP